MLTWFCRGTTREDGVQLLRDQRLVERLAEEYDTTTHSTLMESAFFRTRDAMKQEDLCDYLIQPFSII